MTRRRSHDGHLRLRRAGFAAVTAIVLMGLVASTLAGMGMMFAADARRTRAAAAEAQLRQFLIAGAADVQQRLASGQTSFDATAEVAGDGRIHLRATAAGEAGDAVHAVVTATLGPRRAQQTLHFTRDGERWKLSAVDPGAGRGVP